jgi:large subunit ribosomal protein L17
MRKNVFGRKFKRDKNERKALFKSLMSALVLAERIETTEAKAKAIRPEIEKLVTKAKKGSNAAKMVLEQSLTKRAVEKMLASVAPRFTDRQGGYTRLIKLGRRFGDDAPVVVMEWTETESQIPEEKKPSSAKASEGRAKPRVKRAARKAQARKTSPSSRKATKGK